VAWLNQHVPQLERVPVASNAEAARLAGLDPTAAAIAGDQAAVRYGLQTVAALIQDDANNRTRFVVLGRQQGRRSGQDKTSLILSVANRAGAVHEMLAPLARHGVSMTRFESRPARNGAWEYHFFVDVEGHASDPPIAAALAELQQTCTFFRCLGSYPRDR
jgi:chorismate mutase/prephenate dehydratase